MKLVAHRVVDLPLDGEALRFGALALSLPPLSVNNLFGNKGRGRFATQLYRDWQARAFLELRRQGSWHVPGKVRISLKFSRKQTRADLDNLAKPVLDVLVKAGRIADDRNVQELRMAFADGVNGTRIDIWECQLKLDSEPPKIGSYLGEPA